MSRYQSFIFESYSFDAATKTLHLNYSLDDIVKFTETYLFDFKFTEYDPAVLDRALQLLFLMAGVSYYKTYLPPEIEIRQGNIDENLADFLRRTYQLGLREYFYQNRLNPETNIPIKANIDILNKLTNNGTGSLIGIGGGKDSLVTVELLRGTAGVATWSLGHRQQLSPLVEVITLPHYWVNRQWDKLLLDLNADGAYNGHVPISAIFACAGVVTAVLSGKRDVVVSNEQSANEPTLQYKGVAVNHQYSKSQLFEKDFQHVLKHLFGDSVRYYSLLRPFSELRIAEIFVAIGFERYKEVFSSCNRAFVHTSYDMSWCGKCAKCAFVFLILTPFLNRSELERVWSKNMLLDPDLRSTYESLLGIKGDKPLDCVGEIKESRAAMQLAFEIYPELVDIYRFDLPESYDFRKLSTHEVPTDKISYLSKFI